MLYKRLIMTVRLIGIYHSIEIRARYMPKNCNRIATRTVHGSVYIFDRSRHASTPSKDGICRPDIKVGGQEKEG